MTISMVYLVLNGTVYRLEAFQDRKKAIEYVETIKKEFDNGGKWEDMYENEFYRTNGMGATDVIRVLDRKVNL